MIYCTNCGHGNADASNFCSQCGTALPKPAATPVEPQQQTDPQQAESQRGDSQPADSQRADSQRAGDQAGAGQQADAGHRPTPQGSAQGGSSDGSDTTRPAAQPRTGDTTRTMSAMTDDVDSGLNPDDVEAVNALPQGSALLIVRRGAEAGSRFLLDTESSTVGRSQDAEILLDDISVSRRHAVFTRTDAGVEVKDIGSLNGTYVNREMVDQQLLQPGDEVQIGKFRLVFYAARS